MQQQQAQRQEQLQIAKVISQSKILNNMHFSFFFALIILNIYMMTSGEELIYKYGSVNLIFLLFYLVPPLVVGYRLNNCQHIKEDNIHCLKSFITLVFFLHQNGELKIFRHFMYITPFIQIAGGEIVNNSVLQQHSKQISQIEIFQFFRIFYMVFSISVIIIMTIHGYLFITIYDQYDRIQNLRYQQYLIVYRNTQYALLFNIAYQVTKMIISIICLSGSKFVLIIIANSIMLANSMIQIIGTLKMRNDLNIYEDKHGYQLTLNHPCFKNYWCLIESIVRSKDFSIYFRLSILFYFCQSINALVFLSAIPIGIDDFFSLQFYMIIDSFSTLPFMIIKIFAESYKACYMVSDSYIIFEFPEDRPEQVVPQDFPPRLQILTDKEIKIIISQGIECCICLEKLNQHRNLKQLECNGKHVFHMDCIDKQLLSHRKCLLCNLALLNDV